MIRAKYKKQDISETPQIPKIAGLWNCHGSLQFNQQCLTNKFEQRRKKNQITSQDISGKMQNKTSLLIFQNGPLSISTTWKKNNQ